MSLFITTRPRPLSWSRNVIRHTYGYSFPSPGDRVYIQLQDNFFKTITEISYPIDASNPSGSLAPMIQDLLDPSLSYTRPANTMAGVAAQNTLEVTSNIGTFWLRHRAAPPSYPVSWTQDAVPFMAIKGGVDDLSFYGELSIHSAAGGGSLPLPRSSQILTWVPSGRMLTPGEWSWLLFLCLDPALHYVQYAMQYADGSTANIARLFDNPSNQPSTYRNWYIPIGIQQANLDPLGKGVVRYTVEVYRIATPLNILMGSYTILVDNRPYYHPMTLYYRNSIGGWDNIMLRGEIGASSDAERKEAAHGVEHAQNGANTFFHASIRPKWKGYTGYISREHLTALNDLLLSTECALLINSQWLPVRITSKTLEYFSSKNNLHSAAIEFEAAGSFDAMPYQLPAIR